MEPSIIFQTPGQFWRLFLLRWHWWTGKCSHQVQFRKMRAWKIPNLCASGVYCFLRWYSRHQGSYKFYGNKWVLSSIV